MHFYSYSLSSLDQSYRQQSHQVLVQFQKHTYYQIFRPSVSAASCKPSAHGEHAFHVGLGCWRSYHVLGQWGKQWIRCLPSAPKGDGIFFWQSCPGPKFMQILVNLGLHRSTSTSTAPATLDVCWSRLLKFEALKCLFYPMCVTSFV